MSDLAMVMAERTAAIVLEAAKRAAPKKTGRFAAGLYFEIEDSGRTLRLLIKSDVDAPKTVWLKHGTMPHTIFAVNARFLRFIPTGGGRAVFARRVMHPGTRRDEKFFATMRAQEKMFADVMRSAGMEVVRGMIHW